MEEYELIEKEDFAVTQENSLDRECIEDLEEARATYKSLIKEGIGNLETANRIIEGTEHPRSIEVFANLINTIANINGKLVELQTTKRELTKKETKQEALAGNVTNNLFVGSPADLQSMLLSMKN